ncbi:hypothetical protein [Rhodococcus sp. IEGM 1330]|uniref:hypothetical protein n=1 Tax=Rhodococcus sp. IEGM 1330 TaxID=3082225 RepID=UPI002953B45B|nr:hypothetical protein [Rhodococcus sp. IEGM 1330]MDV8022299.1 hypothetical protein [Rhodococcus sp. IEGM 1330]
MTPAELAAIEDRASKVDYLEPCPNGCGCKYLDDADRYDCACSGPCCTDEWDVDTDMLRRPELGERMHDIETLLAAVRERDNTIARVRALHYMIRVGNNQPVRFKACGHCGRSWPCATIAALEEQEAQ